MIPVLIFAFIVVFFGHLIWVVERRENEDFPAPYRQGIVESMWWSLATITGGDAEKRVQRPFGRVIAATWLVFGLFLVAYVTGTATASLTVTELRGGIDELADMAGQPVATVEGTTADDYLTRQGFKRLTYPDVDAAIAALTTVQVDGVVFDAPVLMYKATTSGRGEVRVVGDVFQADKYGIALPIGSPWREDINEALLSLSANGTMEQLYRKWFVGG